MRRDRTGLLRASLILLAFLLLRSVAVQAAGKVLRVEPPFWWTGMADDRLQLMLYGEELAQCEVRVEGDAVLEKTITTDNPNYIFLDLRIGDTPGNLELVLLRKGKKYAHVGYPILEREDGSADRKGFDASDLIYLLMPDRFANGDPDNDSIPGIYQGTMRADRDARHGGDLQGVMDHLGYIDDLGATAIWLNPVLENNQPQWSYHGYAITDFYRCDPRLGSNGLYRDLVDSAHARGLKVVMDFIFNHCGSEHWWMKDLPAADWVHPWDSFGRSNFRASVITDPHVSRYDYEQMQFGWFDRHMPDLNHSNPLLVNYLIQNTIWWIEYAGIDGIRLDTQPYPAREMITAWTKRIHQEYPSFGLVGEVWVNDPAMLSFYLDNPFSDYRSGMPSVFDFPLQLAIRQAFTEQDDYWNKGLIRVYDVLSKDFVYGESTELVTFLDNHDLGRYMHYMGGDPRLQRMGLAVLATTRGIPMLYYGTELGLGGDEHKGHGYIRQEMPGGWPDHPSSAFDGTGLDSLQSGLLEYTRNLLNWRKGNTAVQEGRLVHFLPADEAYVYFRIADGSAVMVVVNNSSTKSYSPDAERFKEVLGGYTRAVDALTREEFQPGQGLIIEPKKVGIYELY